MTTISAKTILRSRNDRRPDKVLSTLLLRYPRFIHSELMSHRSFSRNSASSRAIPTQKLIEDVRNNPAIPLHWGRNQPGMQANEELTGNDLLVAQSIWRESLLDALDKAERFKQTGIHKQVVNRILEPYAHITVLVSSTEWNNFLEHRDHEDAEPHIRLLAQEVRKCLEDDDIQTLKTGEWHLPFITEADFEIAYKNEDNYPYTAITRLLKLSAARCASTSYKTVDGFDMTFERAEKIYDRLVGSRPFHASPFEHVAFADGFYGGWYRPHLQGNFEGFCQYRKMIEEGMNNDAR